jgi:ribose-phosphate pyrophosphokinase
MFIIVSNHSCSIAANIASILKITLIVPDIAQFQNGELAIKFVQNFDNKTVIIVHSTTTSNSIVELCLLINAAKNANANKVIVIAPYFSYLRQNMQELKRDPASLIINLLQNAGADLIVTLDAHVNMQDSKNFISLDTFDLFINSFKEIKKDTMIIAPDIGASRRAKNLSLSLDLPFMVATKKRAQKEISFEFNLNNIAGNNFIIIDDIVDSGNTIYFLSKLLKKHGAKDLSCCVTHAVFSGNSLNLLSKVKFKQFLVSNTLKQELPNYITTLDIAPKIAAYINTL